jgi:quercetin dioxygenase-like cupin family protein
MAVKKFKCFAWDGVEPREYKDNPGSWQGVVKHVLAKPASAKFEARYFEVAPGGFTSLETHEHAHVVIVVRGAGLVDLDDEQLHLGMLDVVEVGPYEKHQFINEGSAPFGFLCIVDAERDRPTPA